MADEPQEYNNPPVERRAYPQDFVVQTAAILARLEVTLQHVADNQRQQGNKLDDYVVEHRSHHLEDRQWSREHSDGIKKDIEELVDNKLSHMKEGRKIYVTLITGLTGVGAGALMLYVIEKILN